MPVYIQGTDGADSNDTLSLLVRNMAFSTRMAKKLMRPRAHNISAAPKPFATLHGAFSLCLLADCRKEQHIPLVLLIPLMMKMRHILRQHMTQRSFPKQDELR
jgi:hypothetical protein